MCRKICNARSMLPVVADQPESLRDATVSAIASSTASSSVSAWPCGVEGGVAKLGAG
jgi:hypothetical protein